MSNLIFLFHSLCLLTCDSPLWTILDLSRFKRSVQGVFLVEPLLCVLTFDFTIIRLDRSTLFIHRLSSA